MTRYCSSTDTAKKHQKKKEKKPFFGNLSFGAGREMLTLTLCPRKMEKLGFGLIATQAPEGIEISGRTYDSREKLKSLGGTWNTTKKVWILPSDADLSSLRRPPPAPAAAPVERRQPLQRVFRTWICGKKVAKINPDNPQGPMIWVCSCCPTYKSDYDGT